MSVHRGVSGVVLALVCAVLLVVTACTSDAGTTSGGAGAGSRAAGSGAVVPSRGTLRWHPCADKLAPECATLSVPLNYADPGGRHIQLALNMVPATAPKSRQQGILLINPGGPGGSGLGLTEEVAIGLGRNVAADYDVVGFDPRGVGASVPALSCDPGFFSGVRPDYVPKSATAEQALVGRARAYAESCERRYGWLLPYMTTQDSARDMDSIRAAFGVSQLNYLGFSYGTYLGQVYGTLFPTHLRRMVLDSTADPTGVWYNDNLGQEYAIQARIAAFFAWTARYDGTYHLGRTQAQVQAAYNRARQEVAARPIHGPHGPVVGPDELDDTFLAAAYGTSDWPSLAQALAGYLNGGKTADLISEHEQDGTQNENEYAVYNAVECSDVNWPRNWATWNADARKVDQTAPFAAWENTWFDAPCAFWPVKGPATSTRINGSGLPGILMLQGTLDAATPYQGAQDAHKQLPSARMVVVQGGGNHGQAFADPLNACVQRYLNAYLATGALPQSSGLVNATCPASPDPAPNG
jgi:pimeloyl-ACP methyl ester carboxylesterase